MTHTVFFYSTRTGEKLGQWTLPRKQTAEENCTIHNFNVIPMKNGRYIMVSGNYQAGTWVTGFTDPAKPRTLAYSPTRRRSSRPTWLRVVVVLVQPRDLRELHHRGVEHLRLIRGDVRRESMMLHHLNPQTQEFSIARGRSRMTQSWWPAVSPGHRRARTVPTVR